MTAWLRTYSWGEERPGLQGSRAPGPTDPAPLTPSLQADFLNKHRGSHCPECTALPRHLPVRFFFFFFLWFLILQFLFHFHLYLASDIGVVGCFLTHQCYLYCRLLPEDAVSCDPPLCVDSHLSWTQIKHGFQSSCVIQWDVISSLAKVCETSGQGLPFDWATWVYHAKQKI